MKFAKKLQDESYAEWNGHYLDYKMMKKVLKKEHEEAIALFCDVLEGQLLKVLDFMSGQQKAIKDDIAPLDHDLGTSGSAAASASTSVMELVVDEDIDGHCSKLVDHIQRFRDFASLNQMAIRKIIKKFNKRFNMDFSLNFGLPSTTRRLVNEHDVFAWLLDPAQHVLRLLHAMMQLHRGDIDRPLRQLGFWIAELRAGSEFARLRVSGEEPPDPTTFRLHAIPGERLCIRNTFITICGPRRGVYRRRSSSLPAPSLCDGACGSHCDADADQEDDGGDASPPPRADAKKRNARARDGGQASPGTGACGGGAGCARRRGASPGHGAVVGRGRVGAGAPCGPRWWTNMRDICPISGFPISLLPYPPLKLHLRLPRSKSSSCFVDGPFLVLSVLCSWRFEALGSPLGHSDMQAIDDHMRRCKLGPFRLLKALELRALGTPESLQELEALRFRAARRLDVLRHVQQVRLPESEPPPAPVPHR